MTDPSIPIGPSGRRPDGQNRVRDIDEVAPDAVSPVERNDSHGPVVGDMDADSGQGAAGGRDRGGPGGREPPPEPTAAPSSGREDASDA